MDPGRKILNLRCDRRISQQDLAKACDITPSALSKIEAGINSPRAHIIWKIAKHLGVTVEYLLDEDIPYPYSGYSYRQKLYSKNLDPQATMAMRVTREEKAYIEALRKCHRVTREIAMGLPECSVENLRMIHFLVHNARVQNPSQSFIERFEKMVLDADKGTLAATKTTRKRRS